VEQRIVIKFLVGENVPSAEIHHRLQQQYGEECLSLKVAQLLRSAACLHTNQTRSYLNHLVYQAFSNNMLSIQQSQRQQLQAIEYCLLQLLQGVLLLDSETKPKLRPALAFQNSDIKIQHNK